VFLSLLQLCVATGTANEDRVVTTYVVEEMEDGSIKMAHGHRCTGVPIPI